MSGQAKEFIRRWETAVAAQDLNAISVLLAEDAQFYSPAVFKPYQGRTAITLLLGHVMKVFGEFAYTNSYNNDYGVTLFYIEINGFSILSSRLQSISGR